MKKQVISHNNFTALLYSNGTNHIEKGYISISKNEIIDILNQFNVVFDEVLIYKNYYIERDHISHNEYAFGGYHSTIKNLILKNCDFDTSVVFDLSRQIETIMFIDCKFKASLKINNPKCKIFLENVTIENDFLLDGDRRINQNEIIISNTVVKSHLSFKNFQKFNLLKIIGEKSFANKTHFSNVSGKNIEFNEIKKFGELKITWDESNNINNEIENLILKSSSFKDVNIFQTTITESFRINEIFNQNNLWINSCKINTIEVNGNNDIVNLIFDNSNLKNLDFFNAQFQASNKLLFKQKTKLEKLRISSSKIGEIEFESECELKKVEFRVLRKKRNEVDKLRIKNCKIDELHIKNVLFSNEVSILGKIDCIMLENSFFSNNLEISLKNLSDKNTKSSISLLGNTFQDEFLLINSIVDEFEFEGNVFYANSEINNSVIINDLIIKDSLFFSLLIFDKEVKLNEFIIEDSFINEIKISKDCGIASIKITETSLLNIFIPFEKQDFEYYFQNSIINFISLKNISLSKSSILNFSDCEINKIEFSSFNNFGNIYFRNNKPNLLYLNLLLKKYSLITNTPIRELENEDIIRKIKPIFDKAEILFLNSSLGNIEFIGFAFSKYGFKFLNSKILNIFIAGDEFPEIIDVSETDKKNQTREDYNQLVLAYNQLKKIAENNGDIVRTSLMHSKALKFQHKVLKKTPNTGYERAAFFFNGLSNNHGESWGKAMWFIIISSVFLFTLFIIPTSKYGILGSFDNLIITDYLKFIDPFQKNNYDEFGWFSNLIYFMNKIIFGFGVFQLVTAFRRHGKK